MQPFLVFINIRHCYSSAIHLTIFTRFVRLCIFAVLLLFFFQSKEAGADDILDISDCELSDVSVLLLVNN